MWQSMGRSLGVHQSISSDNYEHAISLDQRLEVNLSLTVYQQKTTDKNQQFDNTIKIVLDNSQKYKLDLEIMDVMLQSKNLAEGGFLL